MARDRAHFDAVAKAFAEDAAERDVDALKLTAEERVRLGLRMGALGPRTAESEREFERLGVEQAKLHDRWRKLQARGGRPAR